MDLSSHLESQSFDKLEEDSRLNEETHDLPSLPKAKKNVNYLGASTNLCTGCVFFFSLCSSIISMTILVIENRKVIDMLNDYSSNFTNPSGGCILSGTFNDSVGSVLFERSALCSFVTFGTAGLGCLSLLYLCGSCCRAVFSCICGFSTFNLMSVIDFIVMTVSTLFALCVGVIINIGRKNTCEAVRKTHTDPSSCTTAFIVDSDGNHYTFDKWMNVAEVSAWITACLLAILAIFNMFLTIAFCIRHCGRNKSGNSAQHDLDAFNRNFEDDDDELLDPSRDTPTAPQLVFEGEKDHTSFPPYNTGSGAEGFYGDNPWNTPS